MTACPLHIYPNPQNRVNPVANYRLQVMMWQCRFISYNKRLKVKGAGRQRDGFVVMVSVFLIVDPHE